MQFRAFCIKEFTRLFNSVSKTLDLMAVNKPYGDGRRIGAVKNRTQVLNPQTGVWTKRDPETGRFMDGKKDGTPFKGVRKEK